MDVGVSLPRKYGTGPGRMVGVVVATVLSLPAGLYPLWTDGSIPPGVRFLVTVALLAFFAWLFAAAARAATVADRRGLRVRGFLGTRAIAWADVQDIRSETNPGSAFQDGAARRVCCAYGSTGRRVLLMYVDDTHVRLDDELAFLRRAWRELRGPGWRPVPGLAARIRRGEARRLAVLMGVAAAVAVGILAVLLMVVAMFVDLPGAARVALSPAVAIGVVVPAVFVVTASAFYLRRRNTGEPQPDAR
ncbi:PH domain-containing protein [Streptomyces sp. bgisy154]|uniref:PH domain-containing protein n=1 Tax=Streptomyces sp. bgisy154 TaxID=3413794 RepID=UPI003D7557CA